MDFYNAVTHTGRRANLVRFAAAVAAYSLVLPAAGRTIRHGQNPPPVKGAVVLFSGKEDELAKNWLNRAQTGPAAWKLVDGAMQAGGGDIITKERFTDYQLHLEFKTPYMPDKKGQA